MDLTIISGNVGKDATITETKTGKFVMSFSVAVNKKINGKQETKWYNVVKFGNSVENLKIADYLTKGTAVEVSGEVNCDAYINKNKEAVASLRLYAQNIGFPPSKRQDGENTTTVNSGGVVSDTTTVVADDLPF